jgi:hypothetical protein
VTGVALELREYLIGELVKVQEGITRAGVLTDPDVTLDEMRAVLDLYGKRDLLVKVGVDVLDDDLWWESHKAWAKATEDGPVLLDGEEAPEPIDYSIMEFTDEEKDFWKQHIDDNMVVVEGFSGVVV